MRARGYRVQIGNSFFGRFQAIMCDLKTGINYGTSEAIVDGEATGF